MRILIVALSVCALVACAARSHTIAVWPAADASAPTPGQAGAAGVPDHAFLDHPCGRVREIAVSRLPPPGAAGHVSGTETVVEFDPGGAVLRRWSLPVDAHPLAVEGVRLTFDHRGRSLIVDANGRLRETARREPAGESIACPDAVRAEFRGSEFLICERMRDLGTGASRHLAYEGVCT